MARRRYRSNIAFAVSASRAVSEHRSYTSLSEYAAFAATAPADEHSAANNVSPDRTKFTQTKNLAEACSLTARGWPQGAARAKKMLDRIESTEHVRVELSSLTQTRNDVTGSYVDVGAYVSGIPECMVEFEPDPRKVRFAHIVIAASTSSYTSEQDIMARGACICAAIDTLESRGIRCNVTLQVATGTAQLFIRDDVTLKNAHDPLNLDSLAFAVAHPAMLRRIGFAAEELVNPTLRQALHCYYGGGYGNVYFQPVANAINFPPTEYNARWTDPHYAAQRINDVLKQAEEASNV